MSGKFRWKWLPVLCGWLLVPALACAAPPGSGDALVPRIKACTGCHGAHGEGGKDGFNPRIAGKPPLYLYRQLLNFRAGRRQYPLMQHMVQSLSDAYLREIADYFAAQHPPASAVQTVPLIRSALERGKTLALHGDRQQGLPACASCHGKRLTGVLPAVPALLGLPYDYISAQLGAWRTHTRAATPPDCMAAVVTHLTASDISAVAGWLSAQPLPNNSAPQAASKDSSAQACGSSAP